MTVEEARAQRIVVIDCTLMELKSFQRSLSERIAKLERERIQHRKNEIEAEREQRRGDFR